MLGHVLRTHHSGQSEGAVGEWCMFQHGVACLLGRDQEEATA